MEENHLRYLMTSSEDLMDAEVSGEGGMTSLEDEGPGVPVFVTAAIMISGIAGGLIVVLSIIVCCRICVHHQLIAKRPRKSDVEKWTKETSAGPTDPSYSVDVGRGLSGPQGQKQGEKAAGLLPVFSTPAVIVGTTENKIKHKLNTAAEVQGSFNVTNENKPQGNLITSNIIIPSVILPQIFTEPPKLDEIVERNSDMQRQDYERISPNILSLHHSSDSSENHRRQTLYSAFSRNYDGRRHTDCEYKMGFRVKDISDVVCNSDVPALHQALTSSLRKPCAQPQHSSICCTSLNASVSHQIHATTQTSPRLSLSMSKEHLPQENTSASTNSLIISKTSEKLSTEAMRRTNPEDNLSQFSAVISNKLEQNASTSIIDCLKLNDTNNLSNAFRKYSLESQVNTKHHLYKGIVKESGITGLNNKSKEGTQIHPSTTRDLLCNIVNENQAPSSSCVSHSSRSLNYKKSDFELSPSRHQLASCVSVKDFRMVPSAPVTPMHKHDMIVDVRHQKYSLSSLNSPRLSLRAAQSSEVNIDKPDDNHETCLMQNIESSSVLQKYILLEIKPRDERLPECKNNTDNKSTLISKTFRSDPALPDVELGGFAELTEGSGSEPKKPCCFSAPNLTISSPSSNFSDNNLSKLIYTNPDRILEEQVVRKEGDELEIASPFSKVPNTDDTENSLGKLVPSTSGEVSRELWGLRTKFERADIEQIDSDEYEANCAFSREVCNAIQNRIHNNCSGLNCSACNDDNLRALSSFKYGSLGDERAGDDQPARKPPLKALSDIQSDDQIDALRRVPSVRRQRYRNAIARIQQQQRQLDSQRHEEMYGRGCGEVSTSITDTESSLSFERSCGSPGESFRSSCGSTESAGEGHSHRSLEQFRGDSGYKSLEAQQSLQYCSPYPRYPWDHHQSMAGGAIIEDESAMDLSQCSSAKHSLKNLAAPTLDQRIATQRRHSSENICAKSAERKRRAYKSERHLVQNFDSASSPITESEARRGVQFSSRSLSHHYNHSQEHHKSNKCHRHSSHYHLIQQKYQLQSQQSISKSPSLFSRLFRLHSKTSGSAAPVPTQRDYSVDERTSTLYNQFVEFDPSLESKHTLSVNPRRRSQRAAKHRHQRTRSSPLAAQEKGAEEADKQVASNDVVALNEAQNFEAKTELSSETLDTNEPGSVKTTIVSDRTSSIPVTIEQPKLLNQSEGLKEEANTDTGASLEFCRHQTSIPVIQLTIDESDNDQIVEIDLN